MHPCAFMILTTISQSIQMRKITGETCNLWVNLLRNLQLMGGLRLHFMVDD